MSPTTEEILDRQIRDIGRQIVALAKENGDQVRKLLGELEKAQSARASTRPKADRFAEMGEPIDAILAYLDERGQAATEDEIIDGVAEGGFRGGGEIARKVTFYSIRIHLNGTAKHKNRIRQVGDLIGRGQWDDVRFH